MALSLDLDRISFNISWTAIVPVDDDDGERVLWIKIARRFVEDIWRLRYSEPAVRQAIAAREADLVVLAERAHAAGKRELVLDFKEPGLVTNVPV